MRCKLTILSKRYGVVNHFCCYADSFIMLTAQDTLAGAIIQYCDCGKKKVRAVKFKKNGLYLLRNSL